MKLLVIEDEPKMAQMLQRGLMEEGHEVDLCETGEAAKARVGTAKYDVILLDWGLPDADGVTLLRGWRSGGVPTPVLMLTARGTTGEKVTGLRAGADDYLVKPFDFEELLARLHSLTRRTGAVGDTAFGSVTLDARRRTLKRGPQEVELTAREFTLAAEFFARPGEVLTRAMLLASVWGPEADRAPNVVDVYIGYLRTKLAQLEAADVELATVRGAGYRLTSAGATQ